MLASSKTPSQKHPEQWLTKYLETVTQPSGHRKLTITWLLKMGALVLGGWGADSSQLSPSPGTALSWKGLPCPKSYHTLRTQGVWRYKRQAPLPRVGTRLKGQPWYWAPRRARWGVICDRVQFNFSFCPILSPLQLSPESPPVNFLHANLHFRV